MHMILFVLMAKKMLRTSVVKFGVSEMCVSHFFCFLILTFE